MLLSLLLAACASDALLPVECATYTIEPANTLDEHGVLTNDPCYVNTPEGTDYSGCCADDFEAEGFTAATGEKRLLQPTRGDKTFEELWPNAEPLDEEMLNYLGLQLVPEPK